VGGALPGMVLEQTRRGIQQEQEQRAVGFGEVEGALKETPSGSRLAECVQALRGS
jgi:hypothetical protein